LITSTLLTLFVVPVVYTLLDDATAWLPRSRRSRRAVEGELPRGVPEPAGAGD
jgi:hypothetical protein